MSYIERLDKDSNTCQLSSFWWITLWENENLPYIHAYVMLLHKHPLKIYSVSLYRSQCLRALSFLRLRAVLFISVSLTPSIIAGLCIQHAYEMIEWNNLLPLKFFFSSSHCISIFLPISMLFFISLAIVETRISICFGNYVLPLSINLRENQGR